MRSRILNASLRCGAATIAIFQADMAYAAQAQDSTPSEVVPQTSGGDTDIVVTGAREAQRSAIRQKAKSLVISDSVTQDDIGRLPDTTVVEAARRIPGVSINLLTDNTRGRSEVQRAVIRGFDAKYNLVTIDGSEIASIDTAALSNGAVTRAFNLNLLPASLVSRIDVVKSVTAEYDAQALGGQIDLVTHSAFASVKPFYANVSAFGGVDTTSGDSVSARHPSQRYSAIVSNRVDLGGVRLGFTLAGDYQDTWSASNGVTIGVPGASNQNNAGWTYYGANGKSVTGPDQSPFAASPTRFQVYSFDDHLRHYSVSGKLELKAGSRFQSSLFAGYYASQSIETRNEDLVTRPASQIAGTGAAGTGIPANLTPTSGLYSIADSQIGETYQPIRQHTGIVNWKNEYDLTDQLKLRLDAAYSWAEGTLYRNMIKYAANVTVNATSGVASTASTPTIGATYNTSGFVPTLTFANPAGFSNAARYNGLYWRYINFRQTDDVIDIHPTLSWNADAGDVGLGFRVGARFTQNEIGYSENYVEYDPKNPAQFALTGAQGTMDIAIPSWGVPLGVVDRTKGTAILNANLSSFTAIDETAADNANGFDFRERTGAGFAQAVLNAGSFKAQAGLRYESTNNTISSLQQVSNNVYAPVSTTSDYHTWLPSAVASYAIDENIIAHAAITKTLGRPDPSAYGPLAKVGQPSAGQIAITLGNPAIKPRQTWNYDAAIDLYFDHRNSLFSLQYFHKDLKNEFYNRVYSQPYVYNGATYVGSFNQPTNGASASVNGIEVNLQKDKLPILPSRFGDLGLGANFTRIWTDLTILDSTGASRNLPNLVNQPSYIANASLFYTNHGLQIALSFNAQGKTLYQTALYAWQDTYVLPRHQLDLTARYQLTGDVTLFFEGANLTSEPFRSAMGPHQELVADKYGIGTQLWGGVNVKF